MFRSISLSTNTKFSYYTKLDSCYRAEVIFRNAGPRNLINEVMTSASNRLALVASPAVSMAEC